MPNNITPNHCVLTPFGWKQAKHLKIGDSVIGLDGKPAIISKQFNFERK